MVLWIVEWDTGMMAKQTQRKVNLLISNELGLHARPAAKIAKLAVTFDAAIHIGTKHKKVKAKSILGLLSLDASEGTEVTVFADGRDADEAIQAFKDLFSRSFN
ncbi:MAG: HPr family phosphocarrier protein [bacterium]